MTYKITHTPNSISIKIQEQLYDAQGNPAALGSSHGRAMGVGDFAEDPGNPTPAEIESFKTELEGFTGRTLGKALSDAIADAHISIAIRDSLRAERDSLRAERDSLKNERDTLRSERDSLKNEVATLKQNQP